MGSSPSSQAKPTLYMFPLSAPCRAVMMTAAAVKIPLEEKVIDLMKGEQKTEEFLKINPEHTVPTLVDGTFTLWESRSIMQYLMNKYAPNSELYPKNPALRANVDRMLQYDHYNVYKSVSKYIYPQLFENKEPNPKREAAVRSTLDYLEQILQKQPFIAGGHMTIADLSVEANVSMLKTKGWKFKQWKKVKEWRGRIHAQDWYAESNRGLLDMLKSLKASKTSD